MNDILINRFTTIAIFFLAIGTFTSVTIQGAYQVCFAVPLIYFTYKNRRNILGLSTSSKFLLVFSAVALLSLYLNWDIVPKPSKNVGRVKYFLMASFGVFPLRYWLENTNAKIKVKLINGLWVSMAVVTAWLLYAKFVLGISPLKPLTETMRYAYGTALVIVLGLGTLFQCKNNNWFSKKWTIAGILVSVLGLVLIESRGAQGALLIALPLVAWFWKKKAGLLLALIFACAGSFVIWNYIYGGTNETKIRMLDNANNGSDQIRRSQWKAAYIAWSERPILGYGFSNFSTQLKRIKYEHDLHAKHYVDAHAHNVPLEIAAGTGTVGFVFFSLWFIFWFIECWRGGPILRYITAPFFVAILFEAQFEVILDANNATWISFFYALTMILKDRPKDVQVAGSESLNPVG